ncbi:MAG: class I SAM-dependent methyltransferase [Syntrophaceae bacterium]
MQTHRNGEGTDDMEIIRIAIEFLIAFIIVGRILKRFFHFPAPPYVRHFLDSRLRKWMQPASLLIARSAIKKGSTVLEIGCGSGAYTLDIARAVGKDGIVYALDIQQSMLNHVNEKLSKEENKDIGNVKLLLGNANALSFEDQTMDNISMITVLQEIPDKHNALIEAGRVLKQDGRLAVTELFVDPDYRSRKTTTRQVTEAGFEVEADEGNLFNYTIRFKKASHSNPDAQ